MKGTACVLSKASAANSKHIGATDVSIFVDDRVVCIDVFGFACFSDFSTDVATTNCIRS